MLQTSRSGHHPHHTSNVGCLGTKRSISLPQSVGISLTKVPTQLQPATGSPQRISSVAARAAPAVAAPEQLKQKAADANAKPLRVVITGAGIGGLVLAVGLLKRGFDVKVLERDVTAIRGEGKYRGPIQVSIGRTTVIQLSRTAGAVIGRQGAANSEL